jgi:hypothetical protein
MNGWSTEARMSRSFTIMRVAWRSLIIRLSASATSDIKYRIHSKAAHTPMHFTAYSLPESAFCTACTMP